jgi:hypothetical protein
VGLNLWAFEESSMLAFITGSDIALVTILAAMTVTLCSTLAYHWRRVRVAAYNAKLKQLMIERGMTADEIERVIHAESSPTRRCD